MAVRDRADLAVHWQDGTVREALMSPFGGAAALEEVQQREAWVRLMLTIRAGFAVGAFLRRGLMDVSDSSLFGTGRVARDSATRHTELVVSASRRWTGPRWAAAGIVGARHTRASGRTEVLAPPGPPDSVDQESESTGLGPFLGAAGEAQLGAGLTLRASVVTRLARSSSHGTTPFQSFGGFGSVRSERSQWDAGSEVRLGIGVAPSGLPIAFDLYLPSLTEPGRWTVAASYRLDARR